MTDPDVRGVCPLCTQPGGAIPVLLAFQDSAGEVHHVGAVLDDKAHPAGGGLETDTRQVLQPGTFLVNFKLVGEGQDHGHPD